MQLGVRLHNTKISEEKPDAKVLLSKLRWVTLGYHYNWTDRKYDPSNKGEFPPRLAHLCKVIARVVGYELNAEAAIVNFYALDTVLCGHLDDVEYDRIAPIVSVSFGSSAIFLLGGKTKDTAPVPILIRSGDIMVMGGSSRLVYHGVPRMLEGTMSPEITEAAMHSSSDHLKNVTEYLSESRININVRQVLLPDSEFPTDTAVKSCEEQ